MKQQFILTSAILLVLITLVNVSAAGVVIPYMQDNTLKVYPGDTAEFNFALQNGGGATDPVTFKANILSGIEVATLIGDTFNVPANAEIPVGLRINIPATAIPGTSYPISVSFNVLTSGASSSVKLGTGMKAGFNVLVVERPVVEQPAPQLSTTWIAVIVVVVLIALWLLLRKKKKK